MYTEEALNQLVREAFKPGNFLSEPHSLYLPVDYTLSQGGKRLRPMLVLMACELFGEDPVRALNQAIAVELFHNFTLLHDDIMDQAPLRRGAETVFKKWDLNTAILSGDTMYAVSCEYLSKAGPEHLPVILEVFNDTARKVCEGQQYDMDYERRSSVALADYYLMIRLKTAVLIACCLKIGAILGGADTDEAENMYRFGENLGMAFQLQDDLLDTFGNTSAFGKEIGGDITTNKKTFLRLKAFETARGDDLIRLTNLFHSSDISSKDKITGVTAIYKTLNIEALTRMEIDRFYQLGSGYLSRVAVEESRKSGLRDLVNRLLYRNS
jgi:geranylgeranyl diphosphate synthase type II